MASKSVDRCPRCKIKPKTPGRSYCKGCGRCKSNELAATERARRRLLHPTKLKLGPDDCNCGDKTCNGLRCERI